MSNIVSITPHRLKEILRTPFGRVLVTKDRGTGSLISHMYFQTHLQATRIEANGKVTEFDLGSGLVTNIGVAAMANDPQWAMPSGASCQTLKLLNNVATGTGATAAAVFDFQLQTPAAPTATTAVTGAQSFVSQAMSGSNSQMTFKQVTTLNYTSTISVSEWGLFTGATLSATTGSPFTTTSATGGGVAGTPFTASSTTVQGLQQNIIVPGTTAAWGLITANTTGGAASITIPAWYKQSDGTVSATPGGTETYAIKPVMWDHKVFTGIGVNSGDSIAFTYTMIINCGG